jgi:hypothetical protein
MRYQTALRSEGVILSRTGGLPDILPKSFRRRRRRYTAAMTPRLFLAAAWLVLPLAGLLFAQWPLRDLVQAYSREANDTAQILFALFMAAGVTCASVTRSHLVAGQGRRSPGFVGVATALCVLPWALFMLWQTTGPVWHSVAIGERFSDTLDPGYFLVKLALWVMALLVALHAATSVWRSSRPHA